MDGPGGPGSGVLADESMAQAWYALRSKPNKEDVLFKLCRSRGYEVFYPRLRVRPVDPRSRIVRPMFPGYMFIRDDLESRGVSAYQWLPYSNGLVAVGGNPGTIPASVIHQLMDRVRRLNEQRLDPLRDWKQGDQVVIREGPFEGLEAVFDRRLSGASRVRILLKVLNSHWAKVELDQRSLEKRKPRQ